MPNARGEKENIAKMSPIALGPEVKNTKVLHSTRTKIKLARAMRTAKIPIQKIQNRKTTN